MVYDRVSPRPRGQENSMKRLAFVVFAAALTAAVVHAQAPSKQEAPAKPAAAPVREFKSVNIEIKGNKIWTPSFFVVKKGDRVKITLINAASAVHAFAIEGYPVDVQVNNADGDNTKTVEFTADKAGIFRVLCSMHAGHVGGQLLVLE
jgi:nitrosocyanin